MSNPILLPFYSKISQIAVGIVAIFFILYIGQEIILPLIFALILAILLNPLVNALQRKKCNRIIAITIAVFLAFVVTLALVYFISTQLSLLTDSMPLLKEKFTVLLESTIKWISNTFNISPRKINAWIAKTKGESFNYSGTFITQTIGTISSVLIVIFLIPVYIFLFLFYKPLLLEFISKLFPRSVHGTVTEVLTETKSLVQRYLIGLLVEAGIVATLDSAALFALGIEYAILFGVISALLNIIPYIGGIIAISLPMIFALATKPPIYAVYVFIAYMIVQFIDNNFIVPKIVASRVKINALVSIVVVLIGGALWGIPGMFLSLPLTAIVKVIFDRISPLEPWGFLLGDNMPHIGKSVFNFGKKVKKSDKRD